MEDKSEPATVSVSVRQFVTARTQELIAISSRISNPGGKEKAYTPFKHIPKNLRRRAVSHNVKRMPFRFRPKVSDTVTKDGRGNPLSFVSSSKVKKCGSRKHRRRKGNLLLEFNRRQRTYKWMETHIWHAKRFHIEPKWNYKIPIAPCDKGRRALYRSTKNYATMQDISFTSVFQLDGDFDVICSGFSSIAPINSNALSIGARMFATGERQGKLHIYKQEAYPFGYIGEVHFQWLKKRESGSSVWLWVHPAIREEILKELVLVFDLNLDFHNNKSCFDEDTSSKMTIDEIKLLPKNLRDRSQWTNTGKGLSLTDLQGEVNRIRFSGPETLNVLRDVLRTSVPETAQQIVESNAKSVLSSFLSDQDLLQRQHLVWNLLDNFQDFPAYSVLPLIVRDPRVFLPQSRAKILLNNEENSDPEDDCTDIEEVEHLDSVVEMETNSEINNGTASHIPEVGELLTTFISKVVSPLEDYHLRLNLIKEKMTDEDFCKRRAGLLIPGSEMVLGWEENQIPVILVHRPGTSNSGNYSDCGFDLILPAGWTMAFWIAFAYRAVRVTGLRDSVSCAFETGNLHSPYFPPPDSYFGAAEKLTTEESKRGEYFNLAPAKRPNLIKLSCCSPFTQDYAGLLEFWKDDTDAKTDPYYILRDQEKLNLLGRNVKSKFWCKLVENLSSIVNIHQCLIGVRIDILGRGKPADGAIICIPTISDVEKYSSQRKISDIPIHIEPSQSDALKHKERLDFRQKHQKIMAFLRKKRKKLRRENKQCDNDDVLLANNALIHHYNSQKLSQVYNHNMNNMWLIPKENYLETYHNLSRKPMGFFTYGGNEYSQGKCSALGYVSAVALLEFAKNAASNKRLGQFVLVRNWVDSLIYRTGKLKILNL
ncbi:unnamed protein product [Allacma fusca]|uniref:Uncharacterized protein n=1 Tax=Allacma fusca TaxID=39272 RepID=A0A8J2LLH2_9HEXA|nr:unnamed protein product [Allacma fusca]